MATSRLTATSMIFLLALMGAKLARAEDWIPLWSTAYLSQPRYGLSATACGSKVFFAGGTGDGISNVVDVYDTADGIWSKPSLSPGRYALATASAGGKALFGGGSAVSGLSNAVNIYNTSGGTWSAATLSQARFSLAAAAANEKVFFAGGLGTAGPSDRVDVYDATGGVWTTAALSEARYGLAAAPCGSRVFFAGGNRGTSGLSDIVDVYDVTGGTWSTATLSQARSNLSAAATGNVVFFAGGDAGADYSNVVDIYDAAGNTWSTATLSQARYAPAAASAGNRIFFAGGEAADYSPSAVVDIYDTATRSWSTATLPVARSDLAAAAVGKQVFFGGGYTNQGTFSKRVDIYRIQEYDTITSSSPFTLQANTTVAGLMQLSAAAGLNLSAFSLTTGSASGSAPINLGSGTLTIGGDHSSSTYSGPISGSGSLTKVGTGTLTLSGANSYSGTTTVSGGTLKAGVASVAGVSGAFGNNSHVSLANTAGVSLDITGFDTQIGSLTGSGVTGGNVTLGAATLTVGGDATSPAAYAGVISGAGGSITKIGAGTQILSGANRYTGVTKINAGTLLVSGTHSGGGHYLFAPTANATLGGTGVITLDSGKTFTVTGTGPAQLAIVNPGDPGANQGVGTLSLSAAGGTTVTFGSNSQLALDLVDDSSDRLAVTGNVNLNGGAVNLTLAGTQTASRYTVLTYTGALSGTFASLTAPSGYSLDYSTPNEVDLVRRAAIALSANLNGVTRAIVNANVPMANATLSNAAEGSPDLAYGISSTAGKDLLFTDTTSPATAVAYGAPRTLSGNIASGGTPGLGKTWGITATDTAASNSPQSVQGTLDVYDHAHPAVTTGGGASVTLPSFGATGGWQSATVYNLPGSAGQTLTAGLKVTSVTGSDPLFGYSLASGVIPSSSSVGAGFIVSFIPAGLLGPHTVTYTLHTSDDQSLIGHAAGADLTVTASGVVVGSSTWTNGAATGSWNDVGNWTNGKPQSAGDVANFAGAAAAIPVTLDGLQRTGTVALSAAPGTGYTITRATGDTNSTLTLDNGASRGQISVVAGIHTLSAPVTLAGPARISVSDAADSLTISGKISGGNHDLEKFGDGTLVLSNGKNEAFDITVTSGTLLVEDIGALPAGRSLTIGDSGTVVLRSGLSAADASGAAASQVAAVPEPGTVVLLAAGALLGMARLRAGRWLAAVFVAGAALWGGTARAGVIIADTFTTGAPEPFIQQWHQTAELVHQPETNLPGGKWSGHDGGGGFNGAQMVLNTFGAASIPLASSGSYTRPDTLVISADLKVGSVTEDGSTAYSRGIKLGFDAGGSTYYPGLWNGFTGLTLHPNGSLDYSQDGQQEAIVAWSGANAFASGTFYHLSYTINTSTKTLSNIQFQGSTADYSRLVTAAAGNLTLARTKYASIQISDENGGNLGYADNLEVKTLEIGGPIAGVWSGGGSPNTRWATTGNWTAAGVPGAPYDTADFPTTATAASVTLDGATPKLNTITINDGGGAPLAYAIAKGTGSGSIILGGGAPAITVRGGMSNSISADLILEASASVNTNADTLLNLSGKISGVGLSLTKVGDGTLVLGNPNEYSGGTTVSRGTLQIDSASALLAGSSLTIGAGGTVVLAGGLSAAGVGGTAALTTAAAVPEPSTLLLLGAGTLAALAVRGRRVNRRRA